MATQTIDTTTRGAAAPAAGRAAALCQPDGAAPRESAPCCAPAAGQPALDRGAAVVLAARFKALADPNRLRILSIVSSSEAAETCVCDLSEPLGLGQPTVSHHLKVLVDAGLLHREKRGVWAYYSLVPGALDGLASSLTGKVSA